MHYPALSCRFQRRFTIFVFHGLFALLSLIATPVSAEDVGNFDWHSPGDGLTQTIFQYLDTAKGTDVKSATHLGMATSKGDAVYSYGVNLPSAILKPSLSLSYSSETGMGLEMPYGWSLNGIVEIRRPLMRGYKIDGPKYGRDYLLSGQGFSGVLKPSGNADGRFFLKSSDPTYVTADYDQAGNTWTVYQDALRFTLEEQDAGSGSVSGTALWRVTEMKDRLGNKVEFFYFTDGRISKISYGGNSEIHQGHLIDVNFLYAANAVEHTNARAGFVVHYDAHLTKITVNTHDSSSDESSTKSSMPSFATIFESEDFGADAIDDQADSNTSTRLYAFDLVFTQKDKLDLLTSLEREGKTTRDVETIATFEYSIYDDDFDGDDRLDKSGEAVRVNDKAPASLGGSSQETLTDETTRDEKITNLADFNRDGLPDVVDGSADDVETTKTWQVTSQTVDHDARTLDWNSAQSIATVGATLSSEITDKLDLSLSHTVAHTTRELIDFDGDGYLDVVESANATQWTVSYGQGGGLEFKVYTETLPDTNWTYSAESWRLNADHADADEVTEDLIKGLMDFNGDGWLDLYDPANGVVWLHSDRRGGDWGTKLELSQPDGSSRTDSELVPFEAMRSVKYTLDEISLPTMDASALCSQWEQYYGNDPNATHIENGDEDVHVVDEAPTLGNVDGDLSDDEAVNAMLQACIELYGSITLRQMNVIYYDEIGGFYDLNGDGLQDYVDSSTGTWRVYLNNGHDFEDEVNWDAPFAYAQRADATTVYQMLIDVDADGRLDLARTKDLEASATSKIWYRNTGSGFEETARDLPYWWPMAFKTTVSTNNVFGEDTMLSDIMMDLDHDGAMDYVSIEVVNIYDGSTGKFVDKSGENKVHYGPYPKPYILHKIENAGGGTTELSYRSLATVSPSGDPTQKQYTPNVKNLVDVITSTDSITGQNAETSFNYEDGHLEDSVFKGFNSRRVTNKINGSWTGSVQYEYELDHDFEPLVTTQELYTDFNLNFAPSLTRGAQTKALRFQVDNTYEDYGDYLHLLKSRDVTEYGEESGSKSVKHVYAWDIYGNLTSYTHGGGDVSEDAVKVEFNYVADNASAYDARFYRMANKSIIGTDRLDGTHRTFEKTRYYYDSHSSSSDILTDGQLTKTQSLAGWHDGNESLDDELLEITYTRGRRGEILSATDAATGITMAQTYGFGGAVFETQTNGLGQSITQVLDEQGRVSSMTDPNGLKIDLTYDDFNRVTKKHVTDTDGTEHKYSDRTYSRTTAPFYTMSQTYDDSGNVDQTSYEIEDGFGHVAESWAQGDDGHFLVTKNIYDLRGLLRASSHPKDRGTTFSLPTASLTISNLFTRAYYDALGAPRETIRDASVPTGSQLIYHNSPWSELIQDEGGYQTKLTYDAHHRLTEVRQGQTGNITLMATYRYDPLNRLVSFKDGGGVIYTYSYDGAGRLRQVKHGKTGVSGMTEWYKYNYTGALKTKMMDNSGGHATWEYDAIGRPTTLTLSDSLPKSVPITYTYEYDTAWVGAIFKTTDPSGSTTYKYDELGREERAKRTYAASAVGTQEPKFIYNYDLQGQLKTKTLPSGHKLTSRYNFGYLKSQTAVTSGATDYTLTFDYNNWGLQTEVSSSLGHTFTSTFTTPLLVDAVKMQYDSTTYETAYTWANNGLLSKRAESIGTGSAVYSYTYDALKQLTQMATSTKTIESYTYDAAGNPLTMQDSDGLKWTYAAETSLNQIASRTSNTGKTNTYTYDTAGRVKTWKSSSGTQENFYDGLGRLRGVTDDGVWQMVLDYDADGNLVRRGDNNPYTSSPYYKYSFRDWRYDEKTTTITENDNSIVSAENGTRQWLFKGFDGHAAIAFDDAGVVRSQRSLGAYGSVTNSVGTAWDWDSFHGGEDQGELFHMGQRHLMQRDGMWLQPEPLLYLGIPGENLADPLTIATYRYGRNTPTTYQDGAGNTPEVITAENPYSLWNSSFSEDAMLMERNVSTALAAVTRAEKILNGPTSSTGAKRLALQTITQNISPSRTVVGIKGNCAGIAIAYAQTMLGQPSVAGPNSEATVQDVEKAFGKTFSPVPGGADGISAVMSNLGPDGLAIFSFIPRDGSVGHVQAASNSDLFPEVGGTLYFEGNGSIGGNDLTGLSAKDRTAVDWNLYSGDVSVMVLRGGSTDDAPSDGAP